MLCYGCKQDKDPSEFYGDKNRTARGGLNGYCKDCARWNIRVTKKGGTLRQGRDLLAASDGTCPICGSHPDQLHIDHDHRSGKMRALVCRKCNNALAYMEMFIEQPEYADALQKYLARYNQTA